MRPCLQRPRLANKTPVSHFFVEYLLASLSGVIFWSLVKKYLMKFHQLKLFPKNLVANALHKIYQRGRVEEKLKTVYLKYSFAFISGPATTRLIRGSAWSVARSSRRVRSYAIIVNVTSRSEHSNVSFARNVFTLQTNSENTKEFIRK